MWTIVLGQTKKEIYNPNEWYGGLLFGKGFLFKIMMMVTKEIIFKLNYQKKYNREYMFIVLKN